MNQERLKKLNSQLQEIVSTRLYEETIEIQSDFWLITVNSVLLAPDMSYLDIMVSCIKNNQTLCKTLANYAQSIKEDINKKMPLRKTPIIRFRYHDEMEFSTQLLQKINALDIR